MSAIPAFIPRTNPMTGPTSNGEAGQVFTSDGAGGGDWQDVDAVAGTVNSVNGQTGEVVLDAADVGALPDHIPGTHSGPGVPVYASNGSVSSPVFGTATTVLTINGIGGIEFNRLDPSYIDGLGDLATLNVVEIEQVNNLQAALDGKASLDSPTFTGSVIADGFETNGQYLGDGSQLVGMTKSQVGLGNVDNTSDANKPISTATQTALDGKVPVTRTVTAGTGLTGGGDLSANRSLAADFGSGAGKITEGNDSRLSDTRTPTDNTVSTAKLQNDAVTYAKIQNVSATDKVLGRSSSGAGDVEEIACTAAGRALIDDADATAQRTTLGLGSLATVTPSGTPDGTKFLRDDNTWQTPSGGGSPGGSGSEIQYRSGSSAFGAVANVSRGSNGNLLLAAQSTPGSLTDGEIFQGSQKTLSAFLNGIHHRFVGCLFSQTADATVVNTTTETTFIGSGVGTVTLPANFLVAGKTLRVVARGIYSSLASGSGTINLQLKLGSTAVLTTGNGSVGNSVTGRSWSYEAHITCRSAGASGTVMVQGSHTRLTGSGAATNYDLKNSSPVTVDTTASQAVNLTATLSVADPGVTFICTNLTVEVLN